MLRARPSTVPALVKRARDKLQVGNGTRHEASKTNDATDAGARTGRRASRSARSSKGERRRHLLTSHRNHRRRRSSWAWAATSSPASSSVSGNDGNQLRQVAAPDPSNAQVEIDRTDTPAATLSDGDQGLVKACSGPSNRWRAASRLETLYTVRLDHHVPGVRLDVSAGPRRSQRRRAQSRSRCLPTPASSREARTSSSSPSPSRATGTDSTDAIPCPNRSSNPSNLGRHLMASSSLSRRLGRTSPVSLSCRGCHRFGDEPASGGHQYVFADARSRVLQRPSLETSRSRSPWAGLTMDIRASTYVDSSALAERRVHRGRVHPTISEWEPGRSRPRRWPGDPGAAATGQASSPSGAPRHPWNSRT